MLLKQYLFSKELRRCTDEDLLLLFHHTADHKFFSELFSRYADLTYRICLKYLKDIDASKDQVMNIFERLFKKCKCQMLKLESFKSWLFICIRNECTSYLRLNARNHKLHDAYTGGHCTPHPHDVITVYAWEEKKARTATRQLIQQALLQLPVAQRQCLQYFFYEKKSYRAIAQTMGIPTKKVKSHIQNGKRNMKKILS
jgi:RNA polymerase sigma-70 factor (ECF subfamily)